MKLRQTQRAFKKLLDQNEAVEIPAFLGDLNGTVKADNDGNVYVVLFNGEVHIARNSVTPPIPRLPVLVGKYKGDILLSVIRARDVYAEKPYLDIPAHATKTHQWPAYDTLWVRGEQMLPGLAAPAGGLIINFYGFIYYLNGWHILDNQTIDMTSHIPTSGANWVLAQGDSTGSITYVNGATVAARELLTYEDIPAATAENKPLFAIKMYLGQTQIVKNLSSTDIADLRWGGLASGIPSFSISPLTADLDFDGYKAIAMACDNGATLPTSPSQGQWFLHTPTGRSVLMQYISGAWVSIYSFGTITLYVDTTGTNTPGNGYASGASAFQTVQYALNFLPASGSNVNVTINVGSGTFNELLSINNRYFNISIQGTATSLYSGTISSASSGADDQRATITDTSAAWVVNTYKGKFVLVGSTYYPIYANTSDTLTLASTSSGAVLSGSYSIVNCTSIININGGSSTHTLTTKTTVTMTLMKLTSTSTASNMINQQVFSALTLTSCMIILNINRGFVNLQNSSLTINRCYIEINDSIRTFYTSNFTSFTSLSSSYIRNTNLSLTNIEFSITSGSTLLMAACSTFESFGTVFSVGGLLDMRGSSNNGQHHFENCTTAIAVSTGGLVIGDTNAVYTNTTNRVLHAWQLGEITFSKYSTDMSPVLIVKQEAQFQKITGQTASIGETKTDVQGSGKRIYGVIHTTEGIDAPGNPTIADVWIDTN